MAIHVVKKPHSMRQWNAKSVYSSTFSGKNRRGLNMHICCAQYDLFKHPFMWSQRESGVV